MNQTSILVVEQAIDWHLRLADGSADVWRAFTDWLEADPAHPIAYDRLALDDDALEAPIETETAPAELSANVVRGPWGSRFGRMSRWATGLAVAAAAGVALLPGSTPASPYAIETAPGVQRVVTLDDGTRITMNGGTRLALDHANPRLATLDRGEAMFQVKHDAKHPFEVTSGGVTLRDIGTRFNVRRSGPALDVSVAEGAVMFRPEREAMLLRKGATLSMRDDRDSILIDKVDADRVGGWAQGRLDFRGVPLDRVADDLRRTAGVDLTVAPELKNASFTGTLRTDRPDADVVATLAALSQAHVERSGRGWVIAPRKGGAS